MWTASTSDFDWANRARPASSLHPLASSPRATLSSARATARTGMEKPIVKLAANRTQLAVFERLADLFSMLVTMEHLETAYVRDHITNQEYTSQCSKLIAQFKTLRDSFGDAMPDLETFCHTYSLPCRAAIARFKDGVPATILHGDVERSQDKKQLTIFLAVQHFITTMDTLKLNMKAADELTPNMTELVSSLSKVIDLPPDHDANVKTRKWLVRLNEMRAHDELNEEESRQMSFDLESAYSAFHRFVQGQPS